MIALLWSGSLLLAFAAERLGRGATLIELNPAYVDTARQRLGMFAEVA